MVIIPFVLFSQELEYTIYEAELTPDETVAQDMIIIGDYTYFTNGDDEIYYANTADPENIETPQLISGTKGTYLTLAEDYIYSVLKDVLYMIDVSDPSQPVAMGTFELYLLNSMPIYLGNDILAINYVFAPPFFEIYDISDRSNPELITRVDEPDAGNLLEIDVDKTGNYLYGAFRTGVFASRDTSFLVVYDMQNIDDVKKVKTFKYYDANLSDVVVEDDLMFVSINYRGSEKNNAIEIYDISNPTEPNLINTIETTSRNTFNLNINGDVLFVTQYLGDIILYDIAEIKQKVKEGKAVDKIQENIPNEIGYVDNDGSNTKVEYDGSSYKVTTIDPSSIDEKYKKTKGKIKIIGIPYPPIDEKVANLNVSGVNNPGEICIQDIILNYNYETMLFKVTLIADDIADWEVGSIKFDVFGKDKFIEKIYLRKNSASGPTIGEAEYNENANEVFYYINEKIPSEERLDLFLVIKYTNEISCALNDEDPLLHSASIKSEYVNALPSNADEGNIFPPDEVFESGDFIGYCVKNSTRELYYSDINYALEEAQDDNLIDVCDGTYANSPYKINNRGIELKSYNGADVTRIIGSETGLVIKSLKNITINGFEFVSESNDATSLDLENVSNINISENMFHGTKYCIHTYQSINVNINNNEFSNLINKFIYIVQSTNIDIQNNRFNEYNPSMTDDFNSAIFVIYSNRLNIGFNKFENLYGKCIYINETEIFNIFNNNLDNRNKQASINFIDINYASLGRIYNNYGDFSRNFDEKVKINFITLLSSNLNTIFNNQTNGYGFDAIYLRDSKNNIIKNNNLYSLRFPNSTEFEDGYRGAGMRIDNCITNQIINNSIQNFYWGLWISDSKQITLEDNQILNNGNNFELEKVEDKYKNYDQTQSIEFGAGIYATEESTGTMERNLFQGDSLAGIYFNNGSDFVVRNSTFMENKDYAIINDDPNVQIDARENYWGAPDGPGGEGNGSGDLIKGNINYEDFKSNSTGSFETFALSSNVDTLFIPEGMNRGNIEFYMINFDQFNLETELEIIDNDGIVSNEIPESYLVIDSIPNSISVDIETANNYSGYVELNAISEDVVFSKRVYVMNYEPIKSVMTFPVEITVNPGDTIFFDAFFVDQHNFPTEIEELISWEATGGLIDEGGMYIAGEQLGEFKATARLESDYNEIPAIITITDEILSVESNATNVSDQFNIFPNPTNGTLNINYQDLKATEFNLELIDLAGNRVWAINPKELISGTGRLTYDISSISMGLFILRITTNINTFSYKVIKE